MPELPEVETTRQGIAPHCEGQRVTRVTVRNPSLRWPVPDDLARRLEGQVLRVVERRAKYLFLRNDEGAAIVHLGMSGSLRVITDGSPPATHDHLDVELANGRVLRFNDPRRFGCWLWARSCLAFRTCSPMSATAWSARAGIGSERCGCARVYPWSPSPSVRRSSTAWLAWPRV